MANTLGFFKDFKGADTVLLSTTAEGAADLAKQLQRFASSSMASLKIEAAEVPEHFTQLFAVREAQALTTGSGFRWLCGPKQIAQIEGKLNALANASSGHQYFELLDSRVQLLVSIGEYHAS